jgi:hypothetical protein
MARAEASRIASTGERSVGRVGCRLVSWPTRFPSSCESARREGRRSRFQRRIRGWDEGRGVPFEAPARLHTSGRDERKPAASAVGQGISRCPSALRYIAL